MKKYLLFSVGVCLFIYLYLFKVIIINIEVSLHPNSRSEELTNNSHFIELNKQTTNEKLYKQVDGKENIDQSNEPDSHNFHSDIAESESVSDSEGEIVNGYDEESKGENEPEYFISAGVKNKVNDDMKFILQWTPADKAPFYIMGTETNIFTKLNCEFQNCYVTENRELLKDITDFDAIAFNGRDVTNMLPEDFPRKRSTKQKYIYGAMESADLYPCCEPMLDNYFNWTWTYRLDSDFRWSYFTIYDLKGNVVGPAIDMKWPDQMEPIGEAIKAKLVNKTKAAAWFVSNCRSKNDRLKFAEEVAKELDNYGWSVDIYGKCGNYTCPKETGECDRLVQRDYYFYFSFENSFAEDYVTEKLLTALRNFAVPVVYGGANYTRFLPPGSYLNGRELGATELAKTMNEIIRGSTYYEYHRWRNHFRYVNNNENNSFCKLCAALNNETFMKEMTVKCNIREWWNEESADC